MLAKPQGFPRKLGGCAGLDPRLRSAVSAGVGDGERGLRRGLRAPGVGVRPKWVLEYSPSNKRIRYFVSITYVRTGLWTAHKFCGGGEIFEQHRNELNVFLAFSGLEFGTDGLFRQREAARTLDEAERRVQTIRVKFQSRRLHPEVLKYCKTELMQNNYFHAVFEATKGLAQRIRDMVGIQADGAALVDRVFSIERPMLTMNTLQTETEQVRHKGFATLLKGCFGAVRNPLAHEPKILWEGEDDAADYLSLISLLHRKLDDCVSTRAGGSR